MQLPTIHLNGTSKSSLLDALSEASNYLDAAYDKLKLCAPNGRDYYPQGPAAFTQADKEHMDRLRRLDAIKDEVDKLTMAIDEIGSR